MNVPFFWDGITKSIRAKWILDHQFTSFIVPNELNSGHPPLWISLLALFWKVFGTTLWASRLLLLFVNFGVFILLFKISKLLFHPNVPLFCFFFLILEPTFIAQTTSLNNDMLLLFFSLLSVFSLLKNKPFLYTIALSGVLLTNLRGFYVLLALLLAQIILQKRGLIQFQKQLKWSYFLALIPVLIFFIFQYEQLGWFAITKSKNYKEHRDVNSFFGIFKNVLVYIKALIEYGRFVVWGFVMVFLFNQLKKTKRVVMDKQSKVLLILLGSFLGVFFLGFVPFTNPIGTRYFLLCFMLLNLLFLNYIFVHLTSKKRNVLLSISLLCYISAHFWIYPDKIAQPWDSSLAYLNYYPVENKMLTYLAENNYDKSKIGTYIPLNKLAASTLNEEVNDAVFFASPNLHTNEYFLFSNIENKTSSEEIDVLKNFWIEQKTFSQLGVKITLYKSPNF